MNNINIPLLITTAINPPQGMPFLEMTNPILRKITCKAAVYFWIALGINKIVIADATETYLFDAKEINELTRLGVAVEQLVFKQDEKLVKQRGKGYGEGLLLKFALTNTIFIKENQSFFKSTGKIFVRNLANLFIIINTSNINNLFWRYLGDGSSLKPFADTRFFYCEKSFALNELIPAFLESDDNSSACEFHVFKLLNKVMPLQTKMLRPLITGIEGGTGDLYFDYSLGNLDIAFPCWVSGK